MLPAVDLLAAVALHAAALTVGIASVAAGALTLFMCHGGVPSKTKPKTQAAHWAAAGRNLDGLKAVARQV